MIGAALARTLATGMCGTTPPIDSDSDSSDDESENEYASSNATSSSDDEFWNYRLVGLLLLYNSNFVFDIS